MKALEATLSMLFFLVYAIGGAYLCHRYLMAMIFNDPNIWNYRWSIAGLVVGFIMFLLIHLIIVGVVCMWKELYKELQEKDIEL
jgi:hypothetical protein